MGWEETVLKATKLNQLGFADGRIHTYAIDINTLLKAQAKAAYEPGQKNGRQEVVEYIDKNYPIGTPKWAAQKKKWGLE